LQHGRGDTLVMGGDPESRPVLVGVPRALLWTAGLRVVTRGLAVASTLLLARLIAPDQYGIFAALLVAHQILGAATEFSVGDAVVQMSADPARYLSTAWTAGVAKGLLAFLVMFVGAPLWCGLLNVPEATDMLRVLGLAHVIGGLQSIGPIVLRRQLQFDRIFVMNAAEALSFSVVAVAGALMLHSASALVIAVLSSATVKVAMSYLVSPIRVGLAFDRARFGEMFAFGKWTNAHFLVDMILETGDNAIVARIAGPTILAFYRIGYQLATETSSALQWVVTTVAFPAVSSIQFDQAHVRRSAAGLVGFASASLVPATIALVFLGPTGIALLLGERWMPAAVPLQILSVAALLRGLVETARPVLLGVGKSRTDFGLKVFQAVCMVGLAVPAGVFFGMSGVAWAVLLSAAISLGPWVLLMSRNLGQRPVDVVSPLATPLIAGSVTALVLWLMPHVGGEWVDVLSRGAALLVVYVAVTAALHSRLPASGFAAARQAIS
jgi:PST family polysaccharide transporter